MDKIVVQPVTPESFIGNELKKFEIEESQLTYLSNQYKDLKVKGVEDKEGLKLVRLARLTLKEARVDITKKGKQLRESAVKFQKAVIAREEELISLIKPTELLLEAEEDRIEEEKAAIKAEEERKENQRIQDMIDKLAAVEYAVDYHQLKAITDEQFDKLLFEAQEAYKVTLQKRIDDEQAKVNAAIEAEKIKRAEEERLAKEKAEMEAEKAKLEKERAEFAAIQAEARREREQKEKEIREREDKVKADEEEKKRQAELTKAREEAAEKARKEAEAKAIREAKEKEDAELKAKEEAEQALLFGEDQDRFAFLAQQIEVHFLNSAIWTHMKSRKARTITQTMQLQLREMFEICQKNTRRAKASV